VTASVRQLAMLVGLFGVLTVGLMMLGFDTIGQLFALVQLAGLVGAPLARLVLAELHSRLAVVALGIALSLALSALAAQSLVWFNLDGRESVVLAATGYGVALALLLSSDDRPPTHHGRAGG